MVCCYTFFIILGLFIMAKAQSNFSTLIESVSTLQVDDITSAPNSISNTLLENTTKYSTKSNVTEYGDPNTYIGLINRGIRPEKVTDYFTQLAFRERSFPFQKIDTKLTLGDIVQLINYPTNTLPQIEEALRKTLFTTFPDVYNIPYLYNWTWKDLEELLYTWDISLANVHNNFANFLEDSANQIPAILYILNVPIQDYILAVALSGKNNTHILNVLSKGNYSQDNLKAVYRVVNKTITLSDIFEILDPFTFDKFLHNLEKDMTLDEFVDLLKNMGINSRTAASFLRALNISERDFYNNACFRDILTESKNIMNNKLLLCVTISSTDVLTIKHAKLSEYQNGLTYLYVTYINNPGKTYEVKNVNFSHSSYESDHIARLKTERNGITKFPKVGTNYTHLYNCAYITLNADNFVIEKFDYVLKEKYVLTILEKSNTTFEAGAPLFCKKKIFGLAFEGNEKFIKFASLQRTDGVHSDESEDIQEDDNLHTETATSYEDENTDYEDIKSASINKTGCFMLQLFVISVFLNIFK